MFSKSGSTSNGDFGKLPEDSVLWVVRNGYVLASCVQPRAIAKRIFPGLIDRSWTNAVVLYGRFPVVVLSSRRNLAVVHLDGMLKAVKVSGLPFLGISLPTAKTKVTIVLPNELIRRFGVVEGDQFELKS